MAGLTLDSGALIAYERREVRVRALLQEVQRRGLDVTVPTVVLAETWRGGVRSARVAQLLQACIVEPLDETLARAAGEALAKVKGGVIDALVMASAATRGDRVLTGDPQDLRMFCAVFPAVVVVPLTS
jgi:predicted nucleic acid-binding protein